jgi:hypothetical protein
VPIVALFVGDPIGAGLVHTSDLARAVGILLTFADRESASTARPTRKGSRQLLMGKEGSHSMGPDGGTILEPGHQGATPASARLSKSRLPLHIASLSLRHGAADSAWLKAT